MKSLTTRELSYMSLFTALIAVGAFIQIPIPIVPFTLQFLFTTLAGLLLGGRLGAMSVGAYLALGLLGLPVFTQGGGIGYVLMPTFGYLIGFCVAAYVSGTIANKEGAPSFQRLLVANLVGLGIVYLFGMVYYFLISHWYLHNPIGIWSLFLYCFVLAVPGDLLLCFLAAGIGKRLIPVVKRGV